MYLEIKNGVRWWRYRRLKQQLYDGTTFQDEDGLQKANHAKESTQIITLKHDGGRDQDIVVHVQKNVREEIKLETDNQTNSYSSKRKILGSISALLNDSRCLKVRSD